MNINNIIDILMIYIQLVKKGIKIEQNYFQVGQLIGVPYGNYNPGHWTMGNNNVIYYNPGNSTGEKTIKDVYVYY